MIYGNNLTVLSVTWDVLKAQILLIKSSFHYEETASIYEVFIVDDVIVYTTQIFKGVIPKNSNITQQQNDLNKLDFETNYKAKGNKPLTGPKDIDNKPILHATPRPLGLYTYYTNTGDDQSDATLVGYDSAQNGADVNNSMFFDIASGTSSVVRYIDFNSIVNQTNISQGMVQWLDGMNDEIILEMVPKLTTITPGTNTYFNLYSGVIVIPAAGNGTIAINPADIQLVEMVPNEDNITPPGFWNADFNTTTHQFENIVPALTAQGYPCGKFMIFANVGIDIPLYRFGNRLKLLGEGTAILPSADSQRIGHGVRFKIMCYTNSAAIAHAWSMNLTLILHRLKTC